MKNLICALALAAATLFAGPASAALDAPQRVQFAAAINAETDPALVACRAVRNDGCIAGWYNTATATLAWRPAVSRQALFLLTDTDSFAGRTAGQREMWVMMQNNAPVDMRLDSMRLAIHKIWAAADRDVILTGCTEFATRFELVYGGSNATTGNVTALKRNLIGPVSVSDVSASLNGD